MKLLSRDEIDARLDKILPELSDSYNVEDYMKTFGISRYDAINLCRTIQYECDHQILIQLFEACDDEAGGKSKYMKEHEEYLELSEMIAKHNNNLCQNL